MLYKNRLLELKENKELKQKDVALILNITRGQYCHYETEDEIMPLKYLNILCNYFNVSLDYIFNLTNKPTYKNSAKDIDKTISGARLKNIRIANGLTQNELAEKLNIARTIISKYEKGEYLISTHFAYSIAKIYNISVDYLLGKIDNPMYLK